MPAIPNSGAISLADFATEFGGTAPHSMSEYYRDGGNVPSNNSNVPTAGAFRFGHMRGAINAIINTLANTTNVNLATVFGDNWASSVPKEIIIPSGVTIGGTGSSDALTAPSGMGGTLTITNAGSVIGFGGTSGGNGGNAIRIASSGVTVTNSGLIAGGGGAGGNGGNGGTGGAGGAGGYTWPVGSFFTLSCTNYISGPASNHKVRGPNNGCCSMCELTRWNWYNVGSLVAGASGGAGGAGGAGGNGGNGAGYNQSAASGSAGLSGSSGNSGASGGGVSSTIGSASIGNGGAGGNGGTGGTGGNGSAYGVSGTGGSSGTSGSNGGTGGQGRWDWDNARSTKPGDGQYGGLTQRFSNGSSGSGGSSGASGGAGGNAGAAVIYTSAYTMNNTGTLAGAA